MKLPLRRTLVLHTRLAPAECLEVIQQNTSPLKALSIFRADPKGRFFIGKVHAHGFVVRKVIDYRNSFIPIAHGVVKPIANGTEVTIVFKPHKVVSIFTVIWFTVLLSASVAMIVACIYKGIFEKEALLPCGMLVIASAVFYTAFNAEYESSKKIFMDILKSPEI